MKTYCISDIHGHLKNLISFSKTLSNDDVIYVLGDVVDKGNDSIESLMFIMNDNRFHLLLGNHDYMMYKYLTSLNDYEKSYYYEQWFLLNQGESTYNEFISLNKEKQKLIIDYLSNLPLCCRVNVNNRCFFLAHADPNADESLKAKDSNEVVEDSVWRRIYNYDHIFNDNTISIIGHTPVQAIFNETICRPYFISESIEDAKLIDIDGGLAAEHITKVKLYYMFNYVFTIGVN